MPSPSTSTARRRAIDACPGALTRHEAADGWLARVRLPGGQLPGQSLAALAGLAVRYGTGRLELTARGNIQVRGLAAESDFADRLAELGLLPSATHERVRNIVASPLAPELDGIVRELDRQLCARPGLAQLSGRFLFGLDAGRGDILALEPDITAVFAADRVDVLGLRVERAGAVAAMLDAAQAFLDERAEQGRKAWRLGELTDGLARVADRIGATPPQQPPTLVKPPEPVGATALAGGRYAVTVLAPLGRLTGEQARLVSSYAGPRGVRVTPWRSLVVDDLPDPDPLLAAAESAGLGTSADSRWYGVTACTGRPGCAKALADVQADATANPRTSAVAVHWSGCERRCGRPRGAHLDILATTEGYVTTEHE